MARLTTRQGGPSQSRVGVNAKRPGPMTFDEDQAVARQTVTGEEIPCRRGPVRSLDIEKFVVALEEYYIGDKKSLTMTYSLMVKIQYGRFPRRLIPSLAQFLYHCRTRLIEQNDAERKRFGPRLTHQYAKPRTGQASWMTFGFNIEVVDVDGFVAKLPVAAMIGGKRTAVFVTIMFAVSRRTGAVVGYEIAMNHENAEAFRRCIASVYIPKAERAKQLGLKDTRGLLHGNIDAVFVDNAGMTKEVIQTACDEMGLTQFVAPPARGDLKAVGESLNNVMVHLLLELSGAFSRQRDIFSQELRKIKQKDRPITVEQLETFLLMAIQHVNLYAKKRHLRSDVMRQEGTLIFPYSLWAYYQNPKRRPADQRREWAPYDVWLKFIPWQQAAVRGGKVTFLYRRWSSAELTALYDAHMAKPSRTRGTLNVEIKRVGSHANRLQWRSTDGRIGELQMVKEDKDMVGNMTWKDLELRNVDDRTQELSAEPKSSRNRSRLKAEQHEQIGDVEKARQAAPATAFHGPTLSLARERTQMRRDAQKLAELEKQQEAIEPKANDEEAVDSISDVEYRVSLDIEAVDGAPGEPHYAAVLREHLLSLARSRNSDSRR